MKGKILKYLLGGVFALLAFNFTFAEEYIFFYGQGCPHCAKVEKYFEDNNIYGTNKIDKKEVYFDKAGLQSFTNYLGQLQVPSEEQGVPFLVIKQDDGVMSYKIGDQPIIDFFVQKTGKPATASSGSDNGSTTSSLSTLSSNNTGKYFIAGGVLLIIIACIGYFAVQGRKHNN